MNDKKVDFIICTNNDIYYEECVWYIDQLKVPEGFIVGIIGVADARSMCEAYNVAMESSDAKYKVYMHQDVFIYHRDFIEDIVRVFRADSQMGMVGMVGGIQLPQNAIIYNAWNKGAVYVCNRDAVYSLQEYGNPVKGTCTLVDAIDGMLMATQYDIRWREDLCTGWDFYDISQSMEFRKRGYSIGVPVQSEPWCLHDSGHSRLEHYDKARKIILEEYKDFFPDEYEPFYDAEAYHLEEEIFGRMKKCIENDELETAFKMGEMIGNMTVTCNDLHYALNILDVLRKENESTAKHFFGNIRDFELLKQNYDKIAFLTRHMERNTNPEAVGELLKLLDDGEIAREAVWSIAQHSVMNLENVYKKIKN